MKRGLFIAFEGIDGCGKSTQVRKLIEHIYAIDKHNHIVMTREPYKNQDIRKILHEDEDPYSQAEKLAHLFVSDRKNHIKELIIPSINKGIHVISDRYSFSTLSYQQAQGVELWKILEMHKGLPIPDIIFLVDLPPKIAMKRMAKDNKRKKEHKFEKNLEFIEKLRKNYLNLTTLNNHNVVVIDGSKSINHIFEKQIKPAFDKFYNRPYS